MADTPTPQQAEDTLKHDAERDVHHGLSHLEDDFFAECKKIGAFSKKETSELLAWVASKLPHSKA